MATNKPHFRLTTYGKINPGDLVMELHWIGVQGIPAFVKVVAVKHIGHGMTIVSFTDKTYAMRRPTDKCFASW